MLILKFITDPRKLLFRCKANAHKKKEKLNTIIRLGKNNNNLTIKSKITL